MPPTAAPSVWSQGARTVSQLRKETGLSRQAIWRLMNDGTFAWRVAGGRGTRLVSWASVVRYLESLPQG